MMGKAYKLEHVGIGAGSVETYEKTVRFYEEVFGWHRTREVPGDLAFVSNDAGDCFEIFASDAPPLVQPHHLAFGVDKAEFDAVAARIRAAGATLEEPFENPYGDRIVFFTDPAGNAVQIVGRHEPLPR
jgi:predicted enzyme related to lactoylglutathione lyase